MRDNTADLIHEMERETIISFQAHNNPGVCLQVRYIHNAYILFVNTGEGPKLFSWYNEYNKHSLLEDIALFSKRKVGK
jgi:hypothetical protein